jgi:patatin-like phospholipase/acyl hydrolase
MSDAKPYRILSLDGGGSWALIEVMALQQLYGEHANGHEVLQQFELVAATSGGSIVLAGLAANRKLSDILAMFMSIDARQRIFNALPVFQTWPWSWFGFGPKYSTAGKFAGLKSLLPEANEVFSRVWAATGDEPNPPDILIPAFDYDRQRTTIFRSNLNSPAASFPRETAIPLIDAVHASTTAPVNFFDEPAVIEGGRYWDGAVGGYNNPVLAAVCEALAGGVARDRIRALSIGTGRTRLPMQNAAGTIPEPLVESRGMPGPIHDLKELASSIIDDPPDAASLEAHIALGQRLPGDVRDIVADGTVVRMNPMIQPIYSTPDRWTCPKGIGLDEFTTLLGLGIDAVAQSDVSLIKRFCHAWIEGAVVNQPIRANLETFSVEIGQATFGEAREAWERLCRRDSISGVKVGP